MTDHPATPPPSNTDNPPKEDGLSIAELIHRKLDTLTPSEKKAARLLLTNYPVVGLDSLARFAERAEVSHPTILRFISKLGFTGYPQFQDELRNELDARLKSPLAKRHPDIQKVQDKTDFQNIYIDAICNNIRQSMASISQNEFEGVLALLEDVNQQVFLLGGRFTDSIATQTYMHLRALRPRVRHITGLPVSWSEYLLDMDKHCVVVVFDIRRYQEEVIVFAEEAAQRGASVILVTDQWLSPLARVAQHVLVAHVEAPSNWDSLTSISAMMETFVAALSNRKWDQLTDRIGDLENIRTRFQKQV
ncbi:MurR/RpiR family transcriptional regulator [Hahella ganghwensis]|uniref:MurR/RpiR family transcriptional regulator n=1 Tax=Hahella ganghwensis TaxID=286420 RepID=UPI00036F933E|nr:MurR/RpiR family transcriptional regulator [Hahella ganghwensis]